MSSHRFSGSRIVQERMTQIRYLGPKATALDRLGFGDTRLCHSVCARAYARVNGWIYLLASGPGARPAHTGHGGKGAFPPRYSLATPSRRLLATCDLWEACRHPWPTGVTVDRAEASGLTRRRI